MMFVIGGDTETTEIYTNTRELKPRKFVKSSTGELGYDRLNGTRKIGPSHAKSVVYT